MAFPVSARTTGELITAAIWNADLKDNLNTLRAGALDGLTVSGVGPHSIAGGVRLTSYNEVEHNLGTVSGAVTLNYANGMHQRLIPNGNLTFSFSNMPGTGHAIAFVLRFLPNGTVYTVTWPGTMKWHQGTAPVMTSTNAKADFVTLYTVDNGTTVYGFVGGQNM